LETDLEKRKTSYYLLLTTCWELTNSQKPTNKESFRTAGIIIQKVQFNFFHSL